MQRREFLSTLLTPLATQAQVKSTADLLGARPGEKLLMVHADDAGMCHSVNVATIDALRRGGVSSSSVMMPCPWVLEMAEFAKANPSFDLGLHLTLTSEWKSYRWPPVAPTEKVKGLIDPEGYMWRDVRSAASHASPAEVETELRAQIERARQFGIQFTHFDTHMGTLYARVDFFGIYLKLAREYKVPCMLPRPTPQLAQGGYPITAEMLTKAEESGYVLLDTLSTGVPGRGVAERKQAYIEFLKKLQPGVTKLIVHLAWEGPEIEAVTNNWEQRWADYLFWTSPDTRRLLEELNIRLVTYRELGKLARYPG